MTTYRHKLLRAAVIDRLAEQAVDGTVPPALVRSAAAELDVSVDTIKRDLKTRGVQSSGRPRFDLDLQHRLVIRAHGGNVRAAHDDMQAQGWDVPSYRTVAQAVADLSTWEQIELSRGAAAARKALPVILSGRRQRLDEVQIDHWFPTIEVIPPGRTSPNSRRRARPVVTVHIDAATRYILGATVHYPDPDTITSTAPPPPATRVAASTVAATRMRTITGATALGCPTDTVVVGGVPRILLVDNGKEFLGDLMCEVAVALGTAYLSAPVKQPERKGIVERLFHTLENRGIAPLPGHTNGPVTHFGDEPFRSDPLTHTQFEDILFSEIETYNTHTVHSALGCTPLQAWANDTTPIDRPDETLMAGYWELQTKANGDLWTRKCQKQGVHVDGAYYQRPGLEPWINHPRRRVAVAVLPHHDRIPAADQIVWLFATDTDGNPDTLEPIGPAHRADHLPAADGRAIVSRRIADDDRASTELRQTRQARNTAAAEHSSVAAVIDLDQPAPTVPTHPAEEPTPTAKPRRSQPTRTRTRPPTDRRRAGHDLLLATIDKDPS